RVVDFEGLPHEREDAGEGVLGREPAASDAFAEKLEERHGVSFARICCASAFTFSSAFLFSFNSRKAIVRKRSSSPRARLSRIAAARGTSSSWGSTAVKSRRRWQK